MNQQDVSSKPWWLGFAVMIMGATWIWGALKLDITDSLSGLGPGAFVLIVGVALVLLGGILTWKIARGDRFEAQNAEDEPANAPVSYSSAAMVGTAVFLPSVIMSTVGLPVTAAISYALIARTLGARNIAWNFAVGLALSSAAWWAFSTLGVQLGSFFPPLGV
jgi:putative tricarboxylic transport membrane protein